MANPFTWTDAGVRSALGLGGEGGFPGRAYAGVSTDTRALEPGALFVALAGENFDAHDFLAQAVERGAKGLVISRDAGLDLTLPTLENPDAPGSVAVYRVRDTLRALGDLALYQRRLLGIPVVAVAGSAGKTSTKEMIRAALSGSFRVHATRGNLNNRIGVPLTLFSTPEDAEILVLEMGTSEPGEIAALARMGEPDVAVLTTVAEEHLDGLVDLEGVFREELALLEALPPTAPAFVGDLPPTLPPRARAITGNVTIVGWGPLADPAHRPREGRSDAAGRYSFTWQGTPVTLAIPGRHMVMAALLALAVAAHLGVPPEEAAQGIGTVRPVSLRGEVLKAGGVTVIADCYNANPVSVRAALDLLNAIPAARRRVAVLGTMRELGERAEELHHQILREALASPIDIVAATGDFARAAHQFAAHGPERMVIQEDPLQAYEELRPRLRGDETVLLKASRGEALERLIPLLQRDFGEAA